MAEHSMVHAPYNFVPFSKVLLRYPSPEELPRHDCLDPALKSGEIHVTMTADTPVFVSDGNKNDPHFFRTPGGAYALPGSTIRGMARENMQILGFGCIHPTEDFEDFRIFFRQIAGKSEGSAGELRKYYHGAIGTETFRSPAGKTYSIPQNVHAGYLRRAGESYYIQPVRDTYLRISRNHPDLAAMAVGDAQAVPVAYTEAGDRVVHIQRSGGAVSGMKQGTLLVTGRPVSNKNHLYVFPLPDEDALPVAIPAQDVLSYREDWENRRNALGAYYDVNFWALPEEGGEKPVFYIQYEGHTYFGMSLFPRIGHRYALADGLPQRHKDVLAGGSGVDYPHALLGFAGDEDAYRSRVSFADLTVVGPASEDPAWRGVLGQPKPSFYPGYTVKGKHYSLEPEGPQDTIFQLRGYKQYWLKEVENPAGSTENVRSEKVLSTMRPLPKGTRFQGVIRFRNLHDDELGLLLWSLRLDEGCCQSIGMGKPYGFGRMKLHIDRLLETDLNSLYGGGNLGGAPGTDRTNQIEGYIAAYDRFAAGALRLKKPKKRPSVRGCEEILDFLYLRSAIQPAEKAAYMTLKEHKDCAPLPTVRDFRDEAAQADGQAGGASGGEKELSMAERIALFNARNKV